MRAHELAQRPSRLRAFATETAMPIDPSDPRLLRVAYARIRSLDGEFELFVRKLEIILGRSSSKQAADMQLGDNMNISRQHAKIAYDKASKSWLMTVSGKNGCTVNGRRQTSEYVQQDGG